MKKLAVLVLLMGNSVYGQVNPGLALAAESERIKSLRGKPSVIVVVANTPGPDLKNAELTERIEVYLRDAQIPLVSISSGQGSQGSLLLATFKVMPFGSAGTVVYSIRLELLERATPVRQPDYEKLVPVWSDDGFGLKNSVAAVTEAMLALTKKFATDYLRANPDLQPKVGR